MRTIYHGLGFATSLEHAIDYPGRPCARNINGGLFRQTITNKMILTDIIIFIFMADRNLSNVIRISKSKIINFSLIEDTTNIY